MATNQELREAEYEAAELRRSVKALQDELTGLRKSTVELSAAMQTLKAIEILTRNAGDHTEAVHELAKCWRDFMEK